MSTGVNSTQSVPTYGRFSSCSCDFTRDRAIRSRDQASLPNERNGKDGGIVFKSCGAGFISATSSGVFSRGDYKYQGVIAITCANASEVMRALAPDNLSNMKMESIDATLTIEVSAPRLGTLINTIDDLLMNAKIASDLADDPC